MHRKQKRRRIRSPTRIRPGRGTPQTGKATSGFPSSRETMKPGQKTRNGTKGAC